MSQSDQDSQEQLQAILPDKVQLQNPIFEKWAGNAEAERRLWLFHAQDTRTGEPQERVVRFVHLADVPWAERFRDRVRKLAAQPMPYVVRPLEVGCSSDGSTYFVITDRLSEPLTDAPFWRINGLSETDLIPLLRQLLTGLCAIHDAGLVHGDVRADNVVLDPSEPSHRVAWLTGMPTGQIAEWSKNELMPIGADRYCPPKFDGRVSPQTDLYGLGVVASELLLGQQDAPDWLGKDPRAFNRVNKLLHIHGRRLQGRTRKALQQLLDPSPERPMSAHDVLCTLDTPQRRWRRPAFLVLAALVLAAVCGIVWTGATRRARLHGQVAELDKILTEVQHGQRGLTEQVSALPNYEARLDTIDLRIQEIATRMPQPGPSTPEEIAKEEWTTALAAKQKATTSVKLDTIESWLETVEDANVKNWANKWYRDAKSVLGQSSEWHSDNDLQERVDALVFTPWDENVVKTYEARLKLLNDARELWRGWANDKRMTRQELESAISRRRDDEKAIINAWYDSLKKYKPTLRLIGGTAPKGMGTTRVIGVLADDRDWVWTQVHNWKKPTIVDYTRSKPEHRDMRFDWSPGDTIQVNLQGEREWMTLGTNRPDYIEHVFRGPLALWLAATTGKVSGSGFTLTFEITGQLGARKGVPCPGPPTKNLMGDLGL